MWAAATHLPLPILALTVPSTSNFSNPSYQYNFTCNCGVVVCPVWAVSTQLDVTQARLHIPAISQFQTNSLRTCFECLDSREPPTPRRNPNAQHRNAERLSPDHNGTSFRRPSPQCSTEAETEFKSRKHARVSVSQSQDGRTESLESIPIGINVNLESCPEAA